MKKVWVIRLCAMLLAVTFPLSMTVGMPEEATLDEIDLISDDIDKPVEETEQFYLLLPEKSVAEEEDIPVSTAVSAAEAQDKADQVEPKSAVPKKTKMVKGVPSELQLGVKETYALSTKKLGKKLSFKSSKDKVAAVDKKGVITAKKTGTATITCYSNKKKVTTCKVTVVAAPKKVSLEPNKLTIGVGETVTLKPVITKGSQATFTWNTKDKRIATVKNGKITGKKAGKTTITVKAQNGQKATTTVTVMKAPKKITLNKTKLTLEVGKTATLKATLPKKTASYKRTWKSSNEKVVTVDDKGVVKAMGPGSAKITVTTFKSKVKTTCTVTVQGDDIAEDFVINDGILTRYIGKGGDVVIPNADGSGRTITVIGAAAFKNNTFITSVYIPGTITTIGEAAFEGCTSLRSIVIPNGIVAIGDAAFRDCSNLDSLSVFN